MIKITKGKVKSRKLEIKRRFQKSLDVSERLRYLINIKGLTSKDFAKQIGKEESEVSKWLSGSHNFTIATLMKLEFALDEDVFNVHGTKMFEYEKLEQISQSISPNEEILMGLCYNRPFGLVADEKQKLGISNLEYIECYPVDNSSSKVFFKPQKPSNLNSNA